jgi:putative hydrolase of the HAD superfamily
MTRSFNHVDTWVFDLDNTLYPASCRLFDQIDAKMGEFVSRSLGITYAEAKLRQKQLYYKHGTTLRGLMQEHDMQPEGFLDYVHGIDYSPVKADADLAKAIAALPGRKLVYTNGTVAHATNVMNNLGITNLFDGIFDIIHADYIPKPARAPYDVFLKQHTVDATRAAFFEDIAHNLEVPHAMGMVTVLVTSDDNQDAAHLNAGAKENYIDHATDSLPQFLHSLPKH